MDQLHELNEISHKDKSKDIFAGDRWRSTIPSIFLQELIRNWSDVVHRTVVRIVTSAGFLSRADSSKLPLCSSTECDQTSFGGSRKGASDWWRCSASLVLHFRSLAIGVWSGTLLLSNEALFWSHRRRTEDGINFIFRDYALNASIGPIIPSPRYSSYSTLDSFVYYFQTLVFTDSAYLPCPAFGIKLGIDTLILM